MASRGSGTPPPPHSPSPNRESLLSRKKKEIVDRSMALFQLSLDRCLDKSVSSSTSTAGARAGAGSAAAAVVRRVKRGREEEDDTGKGAVVGELGAGVGGRGAKKKKVSPKEGKKFACPFCKHDPDKYRKVKTCCGPGWDDVHRVKEHIYRRHSLKSLCPRCFEHFDKPEALKSHQRADVPCKLREMALDAITEEQEKTLRLRAKSNCSDEDKWGDMYRVIYPDEKVPSPYYDPETDSFPKAENSRFQSLDECKDFLRAEVPRLVRPAIEQYVNTLFEEVQEKVNQKTIEIIREVETKVLLTFHFHEDQAASALLSSSSSSSSVIVQGAAAAAEPSPPPSPGASGGGGPELSKVNQFFDEFRDDSFMNELYGGVQFDVEDLLAAQNYQGGCPDNRSMDSAYYTSSSNGGLGAGGADYGHQF
ncbi:hypothetical protein C8A00DRAFT_44896 [Chaetomidium leptoderma]|uniref:C2H2-type domain-containing protein n=1 Tax=Chaetomidium leptoderma TaxID=669021 RepID=A0AAN6VJ00_9PEZI|nr:hypothetical protein C8A00DRAFT_44896 [Chaetomidium leptoderma]